MSNVFALHASKMTLSLPTVQSARKFAQDAAARGHICVVQGWGLGRRPTKTEMDEILAQYGLCFHPIWVVAPMAVSSFAGR